jgi:hypothetical protein
MTNEELRKLVDQGRGYKEEMDSIEVKQSKIKAILSKEAKVRKVDFFLGNKHFCRVSPMTGTLCEPTDLHDTFVELEREDEFYDCVKVKITESKAALGETVFGSISEIKSEAYKKVSFLLKPPKKYLK